MNSSLRVFLTSDFAFVGGFIQHVESKLRIKKRKIKDACPGMTSIFLPKRCAWMNPVDPYASSDVNVTSTETACEQLCHGQSVATSTVVLPITVIVSIVDGRARRACGIIVVPQLVPTTSWHTSALIVHFDGQIFTPHADHDLYWWESSSKLVFANVWENLDTR